MSESAEINPRCEGFWDHFWATYTDSKWEPHTRAQLQHFLKPGSLFVDIGAWIGPVVLWALELGATVIAVEPDPMAVRELKRRVAGKGEVEIWEGACAPFNGEICLTPYGFLGDSMTRVGPGVGVSCWTLEHILNGRIPALVKVDVEGYEAELLPSVGPFLGGLGVPMLVSWHSSLPPKGIWFDGYASRISLAQTTFVSEFVVSGVKKGER